MDGRLDEVRGHTGETPAQTGLKTRTRKKSVEADGISSNVSGEVYVVELADIASEAEKSAEDGARDRYFISPKGENEKRPT